MASEGDDDQHGVEEERDDVPYYDEAEETLVECGTTAGPFTMLLHKKWSPRGYERAIELFDRGFYDHSHFFRVVPNFLAQFGISYTEDKELQKFARQTIKDDPQLEPRIKFEPGMISFAGSGPNSRTSHLFIAYRAGDNFGRELWETPIGTVVDGMDNIKKLNHEYGDGAPWGKGPTQHKINTLGNRYIEEEFPHLDKFLTCHVIHDEENNNKEDPDDHDDGGKDDLIKIDEQDIKITVKKDLAKKDSVKKNSLRKASTENGTESTTSHGFEVPLLVVVAILILVIIGMKRRKTANHNKEV